MIRWQLQATELGVGHRLAWRLSLPEEHAPARMRCQHAEGGRVLAVHPDHNQGDSGKFVQVQRAYENLIKHRGGDAPAGQDSWNFHDWCAAAVDRQEPDCCR